MSSPAPVPGDIVVFVVSETTREVAGPAPTAGPGGRKRGPNYTDMMPAPRERRETTRTIGSRTIRLETKVYSSGTVVQSACETLLDVFAAGPVIERRQELVRLCAEALRAEACEIEDPEEYAVYCVSGYEGDPESIVSERASAIVRLLKTEEEPLHDEEVAATLGRALRYGRSDLAIIDWDAAIIFDASRDFAGDLDVLEIANRTLLRFRLLDRKLDGYLEEALAAVKNPPTSFFSSFGQVVKRLRALAEMRLRAIRELNRIEGDIKLYGNWYLARLYGLASSVFHLDDWRRLVTGDLEQLEKLYLMAAENFTVSRSERLEIVQLVGWTVLLVGYFVLLAMELAQAG